MAVRLTDCAPEGLGEYFCLLDLRAIDLRSNDGTEWDASSCEMASANAVFPVPGVPASRSALPENLRDFMRSTTTPHA